MAWQRDMLQTTRDIIVAQLFSAGHTGMINLEQLEPAGMYRSDTQTVGGGTIKYLLALVRFVFS